MTSGPGQRKWGSATHSLSFSVFLYFYIFFLELELGLQWRAPNHIVIAHAPAPHSAPPQPDLDVMFRMISTFPLILGSISPVTVCFPRRLHRSCHKDTSTVLQPEGSPDWGWRLLAHCLQQLIGCLVLYRAHQGRWSYPGYPGGGGGSARNRHSVSGAPDVLMLYGRLSGDCVG